MIWVLGLGTLIAIVWLWRWSTAYTAISFAESNTLHRVLRVLVHRGVYKSDIRGTMTVTVRDQEQPKLTFEKVLHGDEPGLRALVCENSAGAEYHSFRSELNRRAIRFTEVGTEPNRELSVDIGQDFGLALVLAHVLYQDIARVTFARDCVGRYRDVVIANAPRLTGVDSRDEEVFK